MTDDELLAAGLYDPEIDDPRRAELVRRCLAIGLEPDEIRAAGDLLVHVAIDGLYRRGEPLTISEVLERVDVDAAHHEAVIAASGFSGIHRHERVWNDEDVESMSTLLAGIDLLGLDPVLQILRVTHAAVGRIGDAAMSGFLVGAGARAMTDDPSGLSLFEANEMGAELLDAFGPWLTRTLTRHMRLAFRFTSEAETAAALADGVDTPVVTIGFADLVGSTSHAERRSLVELNAAIEKFEVAVSGVVSAHGGRVVKFIGDEVMFRTDDPGDAVAIALDLVDAVRDDTSLPPLRVGLCHGMVLGRAGDYHGPTVNTAARVLKLAPMNGVVAPLAAVEGLADEGVAIDRLGAIEMTGVAEPVELASLRRA